ncbi:MAG: hypothetical protein COB26_03710 [Piscirickettsiaceae bacterium]|nr:MAG: hypothetical protein COB89_05335 [Piscirickettsiaceae bacterium]PCI70602.1 MAG: hypothetical protein COB26_03710 [Piscirickettsiaceae bacterium]
MFAVSKVVIVCALLSLSSQLWAHGGVMNEGNECKLRVGPYVMNFSGYQPENNVSKQFCDDMPTIGKSIIVLDFIDNKLRDMTVNFRVIKADVAALGTTEDGKVNEAELAQTPFFEIPAKHYPTGTMTITQDFTEKGHFVGYVIVEGENEKFISRFPFSVGFPPSGIPAGLKVPIAVFLVIIVIMIWFARRKPVVLNERKED